MINNLKKVAAQISNDSILQLLSFTVDPAHDSASKLLHYAKNMEAVYPSWDFLTVDKKALYKLARKEFFTTATAGDGGPDYFIHSDKLILVDVNHNIRGYYDGTSGDEVQQLINDIRKLKNKK